MKVYLFCVTLFIGGLVTAMILGDAPTWGWLSVIGAGYAGAFIAMILVDG